MQLAGSADVLCMAERSQHVSQLHAIRACMQNEYDDAMAAIGDWLCRCHHLPGGVTCKRGAKFGNCLGLGLLYITVLGHGLAWEPIAAQPG